MNNTTVGDQLYLLARSPSSTLCTFQGYEINGNTFYTIAQDNYGDVYAQYVGPYDGYIAWSIWVPKTLVAKP